MKRFIGEKTQLPITPAVQIGSMLFLSGQVPTQVDGAIPEGIVAQTELVLKKLGAVAAEAGFDFDDFVKTTIFLRNLSDFDAMNAVYRQSFPNGFPARSCVRAGIAIAADVEIEAIAIKAS
jgi:2-iminobutanoate/2-iminopropanoate deaminase